MRELLEENRKKIEDVDKRMEIQKRSIKMNKTSFTCEECGQILKSRTELGSDILISKKCGQCGKEFYLKWRFSQHMKTHSCPKVKHCHYFNNKTVCPFEEVGCKFKHNKTSECRNKNGCTIILCPFQHSIV